MRKNFRLSFTYFILLFSYFFSGILYAKSEERSDATAAIKTSRHEILDANLRAEVAAEEKSVAEKVAKGENLTAEKKESLGLKKESRDTGQIVLITKNRLKYHAILLKSPPRYILDLNTTQLEHIRQANIDSHNVLNKILVTHKPNGDLRIVFELKKPIKPLIKEIAPNTHSTSRLLINFPEISEKNYLAEQQNATVNATGRSESTAHTTTSKLKKLTQFDHELPDDDPSAFADELKHLPQPNSVLEHTLKQNTTSNIKQNVTEKIKPITTTTKETSATKNESSAITNQSNMPFDDTVETIKPSDAVISPSPLRLTHIDTVPLKAEPRKSKIVVVIDPGHGGKDPGATGPDGIHEKNVVLAISKQLQKDINLNPHYIAKLTRKDDYYLTLRQRLEVARKDHANLFVAIHADSYPNRAADGASVFALSQSGATSEAARWLANQENYSELGSVKDFGDQSYMVRSVLLDLSQTITIQSSVQLGQRLLQMLGNVTTLHHNIVEQARFVVLKSPDIISLLVETGFITNPHEEQRLASPSYQKQLAYALSQGIFSYFQMHPPQDVTSKK